MAEIIWTAPAVSELNEIVEYIAFDSANAAESVTHRILSRVRLLENFPMMGSFVPEIGGTEIRQLVESPCRIFYRVAGETIFILHILRFERILRVGSLQEVSDVIDN